MPAKVRPDAATRKVTAPASRWRASESAEVVAAAKVPISAKPATDAMMPSGAAALMLVTNTDKGARRR